MNISTDPQQRSQTCLDLKQRRKLTNQSTIQQSVLIEKIASPLNKINTSVLKLDLSGNQVKRNNFKQSQSKSFGKIRLPTSESRFQKIEENFKSHQNHLKRDTLRIQSIDSLSPIRQTPQNKKIYKIFNFMEASETKNLQSQTGNQSDSNSINRGRLGRLITETSEVVDTLLHDIKQIKRQDKIETRKWSQLSKQSNRVVNMVPKAWLQDNKYESMKSNIKDIKQGPELPEYFKFCLINSKENLRKVKRFNQEIKETRFLWHQVQKQEKIGEPVDNETVRVKLEKILKKFQRIKPNQYLSPGEGSGWNLNTTKKNQGLTHQEQEHQLLLDNMDWQKELSPKQEMSQNLKSLEQQMNYKAKFQNQQLQPNQLTPSQNEIIRRQLEKIFKTSPLIQDFLSKDDKEYQKRLAQAKDAQKVTHSSIMDVKEKIKTGQREIQLQHQFNYKRNLFSKI